MQVMVMDSPLESSIQSTLVVITMQAQPPRRSPIGQVLTTPKAPTSLPLPGLALPQVLPILHRSTPMHHPNHPPVVSQPRLPPAPLRRRRGHCHSHRPHWQPGTSLRLPGQSFLFPPHAPLRYPPTFHLGEADPWRTMGMTQTRMCLTFRHLQSSEEIARMGRCSLLPVRRISSCAHMSSSLNRTKSDGR